MKYRMVRQFGQGIDPARPYRVETEDTLSERDAMALLRELGSPYNGRLFDDRPAPRQIQHTCWLRRCDRPASWHRSLGGYELRLCREHGDELEIKADEALGYSSAAPARGYRSHWPWKLVTQGDRQPNG
jgi:hypothetical protein